VNDYYSNPIVEFVILNLVAIYVKKERKLKSKLKNILLLIHLNLPKES
jgi:hypothetical protein